jgi:hypothetical protein
MFVVMPITKPKDLQDCAVCNIIITRLFITGPFSKILPASKSSSISTLDEINHIIHANHKGSAAKNQPFPNTNPISVMFLEIPTKLYSPNNECNEWQTNQNHSHHIQDPDRAKSYHMFSLIQTPKAWIQVNITHNPISVSFWPIHTMFYS